MARYKRTVTAVDVFGLSREYRGLRVRIDVASLDEHRAKRTQKMAPDARHKRALVDKSSIQPTADNRLTREKRAGEGNRTLVLSLGSLLRLNRWTTVDDYGRSANRWTTMDVHGRTRMCHECAMRSMSTKSPVVGL